VSPSLFRSRVSSGIRSEFRRHGGGPRPPSSPSVSPGCSRSSGIFQCRASLTRWSFLAAVQNERDRISCRRPSYEEQASNGSGLSVVSLLQADVLSRRSRPMLEVGNAGLAGLAGLADHPGHSGSCIHLAPSKSPRRHLDFSSWTIRTAATSTSARDA